MEPKEIQDIVIVYGTEESINTFLEANAQAIDKARQEKTCLMHLNINKNKDIFKNIKEIILGGKQAKNSLIINKAFMGQKSCFKIQLNSKDCYMHTGKKDTDKWIWRKAKFNDEELAQLMIFLNNKEKTLKFFHAFNNSQGKQIYFNKDEKYIFPIIDKLSGKPMTKSEQIVFKTLLQHIIVRKNIE